ncbi:MAG: hypothetical protein EPN23_02635 [Verrucomicrobia bacterium]|nr:MAG: hypothetical protein EPN23_02635 [Verrucomicrobiota bacterium]
MLGLTLILGLAPDAGAAQRKAKVVREDFALEAVLAREDLWMLAPAGFSSAVANGGFTWLDKQENAARGGTTVELQFLGMQIWEAVARFERNRLSRMELSFFNRGDAGDLSAKSFNTLLDKVTNSLSRWTGSAALPLPEVLGAARSKIQRVAWAKPPARLELEWSVTKPHVQNGERIEYRSEFIRLKLLPLATTTNSPVQRVTTARPSAARTAAELKTHVQKADNGDVAITDVPMVDQGAKGYCAAAVTARVMEYYGVDFDQHQAAQVAGTNAKGGTKGGGNLRDALKRIAQKSGLRLVLVEDYDLPAYQHLIGDYNRAASSAHKPKVSFESTGYSVDGLLSAMEPELLHQARIKRQSDLVRLKNDVSKYIDVGIPLIWDVYLGLVKEPLLSPQAAGGHLRLIIGYNKKADEILYSDSWGAEHALKRLSVGDAQTMTFGLYVIKPNGL